MHQASFPYQTSPWDCHPYSKTSIRHGLHGYRRQTSRRCCKPPAHTASQRKLRRITQCFVEMTRRSVAHSRMTRLFATCPMSSLAQTKARISEAVGCAMRLHTKSASHKAFRMFSECLHRLEICHNSLLAIPMRRVADLSYARII